LAQPLAYTGQPPSCIVKMDAPDWHLGRRHVALTAAIRTNRAELRRATAAAKQRAGVWHVSQRQQHIVLIVFSESGFSDEPATLYLAQIGRRRGWPSATDAQLQRLVQDWFMAVDSGDLAKLTDAANPADAAALHDAQCWLEEWRLTTWARRQNVERGVAPSTAAVLQRLSDDRAAAGHDDPCERGTTAEPAARMWASRFRRRWGGRYGRLTVGDDVDVPEVLEKALPLWGWSYCSGYVYVCEMAGMRTAGLDLWPPRTQIWSAVRT